MPEPTYADRNHVHMTVREHEPVSRDELLRKVAIKRELALDALGQMVEAGDIVARDGKYEIPEAFDERINEKYS